MLRSGSQGQNRQFSDSPEIEIHLAGRRAHLSRHAQRSTTGMGWGSEDSCPVSGYIIQQQPFQQPKSGVGRGAQVSRLGGDSRQRKNSPRDPRRVPPGWIHQPSRARHDDPHRLPMRNRGPSPHCRGCGHGQHSVPLFSVFARTTNHRFKQLPMTFSSLPASEFAGKRGATPKEEGTRERRHQKKREWVGDDGAGEEENETEQGGRKSRK
jgi:hypothetical protein